MISYFVPLPWQIFLGVALDSIWHPYIKFFSSAWAKKHLWISFGQICPTILDHFQKSSYRINFPALVVFFPSNSMGNGLICMPKKERGGIVSRSKRTSNSRSQRKMVSEEELLHHQALAMAIQQHQLSQRFNGSMSRRIGSTSSRRRDLPDSITNGKQVTFRLQPFQPSVLVAPLHILIMI